MRPRILLLALAVQLVLAGVLIYFAVTGFPFFSSPASAGAAQPTANRFDGARAYRLARMQVDLGPRPAGSPAARRLALRLRGLLPHGRIERVPGGLRNVVGDVPGRGPAVVVAAHYDTKDLPGFVGANDGAAGTAVVLELARDLARRHRPPGARPVRFVLFDGEEAPRGVPDSRFYAAGLRGSKAYLAAHPRGIGELVLLDFVGNRDLRLPREQGSDPALWGRLRAAARAVGVGAAFPDATYPEILDDHTPFARAGIPAVDLIDFSYPQWHTRADDLAHISAHSLDVTGEAVLALILRERVRRTL